MYVIDGIGRAKNAAGCPSSGGGVKVGSGPMVPTVNCSKSRPASASLVVRVVQIPYCDRPTRAGPLVLPRASSGSSCSQGPDESSMLIAHTLPTI